MRRSPFAVRPSLALALICAAELGCSGGDYWLGGGNGPGGSGGGPGITLPKDWVLSGPDPVEIGGGGAPCRINGNGYGITSDGTFTGKLWIHDCDFYALGSAQNPAIDVELGDPGSLVIERSTFHASGEITFWSAGDTPATFRDNVIFADSAITLGPFDSTPAFYARGPSTAPKLFQGNRVYRGAVRFESPNWLVGGEIDADSNLLIGLRAGVSIGGSGLVLRGNYVHDEHLADAGDESCIDTDYSVSDALVEHNVLRRGTWVVRGFGGEFRYNAVLDADNLAFLQQPFANTRLHHNLMAMCQPAMDGSAVQGGIQLVNDRSGGIEIFNNTLDGGGNAVLFGGPAVSIESGSMLASLRSNLIANFMFKANAGDAAIRPGNVEGTNPPPVRLDYADYNLFDNQGEDPVRNYGVTVSGLVLRQDAGFALNDATPGGAVDQQVAPALPAFGNCFPYTDDAIRAGTVTVSQMLAALRTSYTPLAGSPALSGGDPQDGAGNFIGAVGDGTLASDLFGRFAAP